MVGLFDSDEEGMSGNSICGSVEIYTLCAYIHDIDDNDGKERKKLVIWALCIHFTCTAVENFIRVASYTGRNPLKIRQKNIKLNEETKKQNCHQYVD